MSQILYVHPEHPQKRLLQHAAKTIQDGGIIVYPTDSVYALGCRVGDKKAMDRIRRFRHLNEDHNFTLICRDLSELATYAIVDNAVYRLLKSHTPGPYTFILPATKEVPRRLQHPKRKTIGLRIPGNIITQGLLGELKEPLMSVTLILPGTDSPVSDPDEVFEKLEKHVDLILHGGASGLEETTVVNCLSGVPEVLRTGKGTVEGFSSAHILRELETR